MCVSAYSDYPPAATAIEQGSNVERIVNLKPDVVLAWREGNPQRQVDQLTAFGIKVVWLAPTTVSLMMTGVRDLKTWRRQPEAAEREAAHLQQQ